MFKIGTPSTSDTLIQAMGVINQAALNEVQMRAKATLTGLFGQKNELWLGKPTVYDLAELATMQGEELPATLQILARTNDLLVVQLACSFRAAPSCQFIRATLRARLTCEDSTDDYPVAQDIFPRHVDLPITYKRAFALSPELKLEFDKVAQIEASAFDLSRTQEYLIYEPEITAFGAGENTPGWDFNKSKSRPIRGIKDLFILVRKRKGAALAMFFDVSASIQTNIGPLSLSDFLLTGSNTPLVLEKVVIT